MRLDVLHRYARWLHTRWPAGVMEKLPHVNGDGTCNIPGLYITGDLTGIPLLKFSSDSGARAVQSILRDPEFRSAGSVAGGDDTLDLAIVGAGVSGMAAVLEARKAGLRVAIYEATEPFSTVVNFPKGKPIFTYPTGMVPAGDLRITAAVKEELVEELRSQTTGRGVIPEPTRVETVVRKDGRFELVLADGARAFARRVIVAIGRSGDFRRLGVPGEDLDKVYNRLHDPMDFSGSNVLVVGGGDSAVETAVAISQCGGSVTISYRGREFTRPKPENVERLQRVLADPTAEVDIETPVSERVTTSSGEFVARERKPGTIRLRMGSTVKTISEHEVTLTGADGHEVTIPNDVVFAMTGRAAPLEFFRKAGVRIAGEIGAARWIGLGLFVLFCAFVYNWKAGGELTSLFERNGWFPFDVPALLSGSGASVAAQIKDPSTLLGTLSVTLSEPGFYYSLAYTALVIIFGIRRIRRRRTPYVTVQTLSLTAIQVFPLFLLPYVILPYLGHNGWFDSGIGKSIADALFPTANYGQGREYWRAFGLILAWPLFLYNVFTYQPLWWWLGISLVQTFVLVPLIVHVWGKGAYCGWICSCGAMAETLGDTHRQKMPHGAAWNRVNMLGQGILAVAFLLLLLRVMGWAAPQTALGRTTAGIFEGLFSGWSLFGIELNYKHVVDLFLAGIIGYGTYFWFSGRVWCRFACPLAALMHIYARFSRFRIIPEKKKCISCNVCTSVCHQGIDIMNFANKGLPMEDPECVRCSACVYACPTGVLQFGQVDRRTGEVMKVDALEASPVLMRERTLSEQYHRALSD